MAIRLLLADQNEQFLNHFLTYLAHRTQIRVIDVCHSGEELVRQSLALCPDVVLTDLILRGMDGLTALKSLQRLRCKFAAIVCTEFYNDLCVKRAQQYGASGFLCKPVVPQVICDTIQDSLTLLRESAPAEDIAELAQDNRIETAVTSQLLQIGFSSQSEGFRLLRDSIVNAILNPSLLSSMTKQLYPELARIHHTTPDRVERNIRSAIQKASNRGGSFFQGHRPTNREMISAIVRDFSYETE